MSRFTRCRKLIPCQKQPKTGLILPYDQRRHRHLRRYGGRHRTLPHQQWSSRCDDPPAPWCPARPRADGSTAAECRKPGYSPKTRSRPTNDWRCARHTAQEAVAPAGYHRSGRDLFWEYRSGRVRRLLPDRRRPRNR